MIFGIGLSKTGTTSLNKALNILEYQSAHYPIGSMQYLDAFPFSTSILNKIGYKFFNHPFGIHNYRLQKPCIDLSSFSEFDAFTDIPISFSYKELDRIYPSSKFILTIRGDMNKWLNSCKRHVSNPYRPGKPKWWNDSEMGKWEDSTVDFINRLNYDVYGVVKFDEQKFREAYIRHEQDVRAYFSERPGDLLIIDFTSGEGWEKLCPFLNKPQPSTPFPAENITS